MYIKVGIIAVLLTAFSSMAFGQAAPTVTLTASPTTGPSPLQTTLTWSSTNASSCTASGGWTGARPTSGSQVITGLTANTSFTLTCSGGSGSARLSWTATTDNTDGTPATIQSYEVYSGSSAAAVGLSSPIATVPGLSYTANGLPVGLTYFGVRAVRIDGVRSDMSNIASKNTTAQTASASASVTVTSKPSAPTLTVSDVIAYTPVKFFNKTYMVRVGKIPLGTQCFNETLGQFNRVPSELVTFSRKQVGKVHYAKCSIDESLKIA